MEFSREIIEVRCDIGLLPRRILSESLDLNERLPE
jgi:hypothetical protein